MNFLFYTKASPYGTLPVGGAETSLRLLAENLAARGHLVFFYTESRETSLVGFSKKSINGVRVLTNKRFLFPWLNSYAIKKITGKIKSRNLRKILSTKKIDIVHTYYNIEACLQFLQLRELIPFKFVVRIAGMRPFEHVLRRPEFIPAYQRLFREADLLNFISKGLYTMYQEKKDHLKLEINTTKVFVKDIGTSISVNKTWTPTFEKFQCLMVSRFTTYQKRQDILVKAISLLPKDMPIALLLVGSGKNAVEIKKLISSLQLEAKIEILSFLPQDELQDLILNANLLCHACDHEGLSKVIIESMGMGVPVLASNVAPLNTYIKDGQNGFLTKNTPEAWAEKLSSIYDKRAFLNDISKNASTFVKQNYSAQKNVKTYESEFKKLLKTNV